MDDLKNEDNIKNEEYLKKGDGFENCPPLPSPWKITWNFSRWLFTVTAAPRLMLNRKWYQASKPEMEFHMMNMIHAALPMRAQREKTILKCKDDSTLTKHTWRWTYSLKKKKLSSVPHTGCCIFPHCGIFLNRLKKWQDTENDGPGTADIGKGT